ncbi:MAG: response regulator transcription factor, partial [Chitinophagaceae bacterium]|nr:response regulator transcription factor [Chitinophagaceae bacterium]
QPEEAMLFIHHYKPDVVFLDIEMPRMNGFKLIDEMEEVEFEIVFVTAYNQYAIDAIRISAFDYLIKPVAVKDLQTCVDRLLESRIKKTRERLSILKQSLADRKSQDEKIAMTTSDGIDFFDIKNIIRIEIDNNLTNVILTGGQKIPVTMHLKDLEELLLKYRFFRIHTSHLINLAYIKKYKDGETGEVIMQNGDTISIAKRKKDDFLKLITS